VLSHNEFNQDNQSAIRFEQNGRKSCGPNSRHIDIRYFFVADRLKREDFKIKYCPTEQMLADFFTKPLQGSLFRKLRDVILGSKHISTLTEQEPVASKERVGIDSEVSVIVGGDATDPKALKRTDVQKKRLDAQKGEGETGSSKQALGKVSYAQIVKGARTAVDRKVKKVHFLEIIPSC
jgi:hypothetical protein